MAVQKGIGGKKLFYRINNQWVDTVPDNPTNYESAWFSVRIGGGGMITGLDQVTLGGVTTLVARSDGKMHRWNNTTEAWERDQTAVGLGITTGGTTMGGTATLAKAIAPTQPKTQYAMFFDDVWRTSDGGDNWTRANLNIEVNGNDGFRNAGPRLAIDPRDPNHVIMGTNYDGLLITTNGTSWSPANLPVDPVKGIRYYPKQTGYGDLNRSNKTVDNISSVCPGITAVLFDPSSPATAQGYTSRVYAFAATAGVLVSNDGGSTWVLMPGQQWPYVVQSISLSPHNGDLLAIVGTPAFSIRRESATTGGTFTITLSNGSSSVTTPALNHHATSSTILNAVNLLGLGTWLINRYVNESNWATGRTIDYILYHTINVAIPTGVTYTMTLNSSTSGGPLVMQEDTVALGGERKVIRYRASEGWIDKTPGNPPRAWGVVTHHPTVAGHVILGGASSNQYGNRFRISLDNGNTWAFISGISVDVPGSDVEWLGLVAETVYMGAGDIKWDPINPRRFLLCEGIGVWENDLSSVSVNDPTLVMRSKTNGIEHLVNNDLLCLPAKTGDVDSRLVTAQWDRPIFVLTNRNKNPTTYYPTIAFGSCWTLGSIPSDPDFITAAVMNHQNGLDTARTCVSTNRGDTWTAVPTLPDESINSWGLGYICPSTRQNWLWHAPSSRTPVYTLDGGSTYTPITLPGGANAKMVDTTSGGTHFSNRKAAISLGANHFLLMVRTQGVFKTTNGGANWSLVAPWTAVTAAIGSTNDGYPARLYAVDPTTGGPGMGSSAHLYWIPGLTTSDPATGTDISARSTDGGVTWQPLTNIGSISSAAFGPKIGEGSGYTVCVSGYDTVGNAATSISNDMGANWQTVAGFPGGYPLHARTATADPAVRGRFYFGTTAGNYVLDVPAGA